MRRAFTLVESLVVVAIVVILAAILLPVLGSRHIPTPRSVCHSNLKQMALGHIQYIQDYDDLMPQISAGNQGWVDLLQPYMISAQIYQCPTAENRAIEKAPLSTDYFLNARVAGLKRSRIPSGSQTLLLGEGFDNGGTNSHFSELPFDWLTAEKSPIKRHLDGANYAWVDGHVKWLRPERVSTLKLNKKSAMATFAVR